MNQIDCRTMPTAIGAALACHADMATCFEAPLFSAAA